MLPLLTEVPVGCDSVVSRSYGAFLQLHANTIVPVFPLVAGWSLGFGVVLVIFGSTVLGVPGRFVSCHGGRQTRCRGREVSSCQTGRQTNLGLKWVL